MPRSTLKSFFGFARPPFPPSCPPEPLFRSSAIESAIEQAKNALANRLSVLVTAPPGTGKSSFLRLLVGEFNPRDLKPVRLTGQGLGFLGLVAKLRARDSAAREISGHGETRTCTCAGAVTGLCCRSSIVRPHPLRL